MQILIVDSSVQVIDRLEEILSEAESVCAIHRAVSYNEAAVFFKEDMPDVVLLDSGLRGNGTINLLKKIKETGSKALVIILSTRYDDFLIKECKLNGADFFFDKYYEFEKIPAIIDSIAANKN